MPVGYAGLAIGVLNLAIVVPQVFVFFFSSVTPPFLEWTFWSYKIILFYIVLPLLHVSIHTTTLICAMWCFDLSYAINSLQNSSLLIFFDTIPIDFILEQGA